MSWVNWTLFPGRSDGVLLEKGELVNARGEVTNQASWSGIILSRALCRFKYLPQQEGTTPGEAARVALLHAESRAPFANAGHAIYRAKHGHLIWWWDSDRVGELLGDARCSQERLTPESMTYVLEDGWRQIQSVDGFEAQYVRGGSLRASLWRRRAFDTLQWRAFAEAVEAPDVVAPTEPPAPLKPALRTDRWRSSRLLASAPWRRVERVALATAAVALVIALGLGAHALRYDATSDADRVAIARATADMQRISEANGNARNAALVRAASRHASPPEHLVAAADVLRAASDAGIVVTGWRSNGESIEFTGAASGDVGLEALGVALEANPRLREVAPLRKDGDVVVTARVEAAGSALADGTAP